MGNKRVFIGWNGEDNKEIARKIGNRLSTAGYLSIVGGQWRKSLTVSEEIIQQMNGCEFAIILIEKETRTDQHGKVTSMGFNPNVMMELGYMLHKVTDPNRIRRILINMEPSELPSDLQGSWSLAVKKPAYEPGDDEAREQALAAVVDEVVADFLDYMQVVITNTDKLDYFDKWEANGLDIYEYEGQTRISEKLIYGMQATIYSGEFERLYQKLLLIKNQLAKKDQFGDYPCVACAIAVLNVFVSTKRLTEPLTELQFEKLYEALSLEYEKDIRDKDLRTWCGIFRVDKQELCCELFAETLEDDEEKIDYYLEALSLCHRVIEMIEAHVREGENGEMHRDAKYALLYKAFASRNVSQIHKRLAQLQPEKAAEHLAEQKKYCAITLRNRKELYDYYKGTPRENALSMDFIKQEYVLSLAEQAKFEESRIEKRRIDSNVKLIVSEWRERNQVRNMIFEKVEQEVGRYAPTAKE